MKSEYNARAMSENTPVNTAPGSSEEELIAVRREKVGKIRDLGVNPYGGRFDVTTNAGEIKANFEEGKQVKFLGRITALRDMGNTQFFSVSDVRGSIQCMLTVWRRRRRGFTCPRLMRWRRMKKCFSDIWRCMIILVSGNFLWQMAVRRE